MKLLNNTILLTALWLVLLHASAESAEISGPEIKIQNNNIVVKAELNKTNEIEAAIVSGIEKEIVFTVELFRAWSFWPDEFVVSKKIRRTIKFDNLRGDYTVSSDDGTLKLVRKFKDFEIMKPLVFNFDGINLANVRELESGNYYLRVIVESKSREIPRVIGLIMLLIPEVEMSLAKESDAFIIGDIR